MKALFILFIILTFLFSATVTYAADANAVPTPVGRVIWIQGTLKAIMPNHEERALQKTSIIYLNDTLVTDATSQAQIVFTDNTLMTFKPDTKFYINQYEYQPTKGKKSVGKYIMNLLEGGFRTITGLIAKNNPSDYQVNTPVATIGVRGTDYAVYLQNGQLFMNYYSGSPCISNAGGALCLSEANRYAQVPSAKAAPKVVTQQPAGFKQKLNIIPATIAPFTGGPSGGTPSGTTTTTTTTTTGTETGTPSTTGSEGAAGSSGVTGTTPSGGTVNSFCIQ